MTSGFFGKRAPAARTRPLADLLAVTFNDEQIQVEVLADLPPELNATVRWNEIARVCWGDGGLMGSDQIFLTRRGDLSVVTIPIEARGGNSLFGALTTRGLFPEHVWRAALADTSGGLYCWPPFPEELARRRRERLISVVIVVALSIGAIRVRSWELAALAAYWAFLYLTPERSWRRGAARRAPGGGAADG